MNQLNSLILEGNVVKDSVLTEPCTGFKKLSFTIGVNRFYKNAQGEEVNEASFFHIEAYGNIAEHAARYAKKGRGLRIVGRLKQDRWTDGENKNCSRIYVVAEYIEYKPVKKAEPSQAEQTA